MTAPCRGRFACAGVETNVEYALLGDDIGVIQADAEAALAWRTGIAHLRTEDGRRRPVVLTLIAAGGRGYLFVPAGDETPSSPAAASASIVDETSPCASTT